MNKFEIARFNSDERVEKFMKDHDTVLSTKPLYMAEKVFFDAGMIALRAAKQAQAEIIDVYAAAKAEKKAIMSNSVITIAMRGFVQARHLHNTELELALDKPVGYIYDCDGSTAADRAYEMKKLMSDNIAILTEIQQADIIQMEADITAYNLLLNRPMDEIKIKKAIATDPIPDILNEIDESKYAVGKLVHSYFPSLAGEWDVIVKVGTPAGVRHTSIAIHYTDDATGVHLKNIKCTITNGQETIIKKSTIKGWVRVYSLDPGNWTVTSEYTDYITDVQTDVGVDEDHIVRFDIKLKKKDPNDPEITTGILDLFAYDSETQEPLPGVQVSIPELDYVNTTDEDGEDYKDLVPPGQYIGTLFMDGYKPLDFVFTIEAAKTTNLQLYLEKAM